MGACCLRAWPPARVSAERLRQIHHFMQVARAAGLAFVPEVIAARGGATMVESGGRLWEIAAWMPGRADFREQPSTGRIAAAFRALAEIHIAWESFAGRGPIPAVARRERLVRDWTAFVATGWRPPGVEGDLRTCWVERAFAIVNRCLSRVCQQLALWDGFQGPLQPCLCDIWHDHVLFSADTVTGVVDYGSMKQDHVSVDLARLMGSMAGDDSALRAAGFAAYSRLRPLSMSDESLVRMLDETGAILGAANWLLWLYRDGGVFDDAAAVTRRLVDLVQRIERWH